MKPTQLLAITFLLKLKKKTNLYYTHFISAIDNFKFAISENKIEEVIKKPLEINQEAFISV